MPSQSSPMGDVFCRECSSRAIVIEGRIHADACVECADCGAAIGPWGAFLERLQHRHAESLRYAVPKRPSLRAGQQPVAGIASTSRR